MRLKKGKSISGSSRKHYLFLLVFALLACVIVGCSVASLSTDDNTETTPDSFFSMVSLEQAKSLLPDEAVLLNNLLDTERLQLLGILENVRDTKDTEVFATEEEYLEAIEAFRKSLGTSIYETVLAGFGSPHCFWEDMNSSAADETEPFIPDTEETESEEPVETPEATETETPAETEPEESEDPDEEDELSPEELALRAEQALKETKKRLLGSIFVVDATKVDNYLNVRSVPDGEVVAKLFPKNGGQIISIDGVWAQIVSGNATGWVSLDHIITGDALLSCEYASIRAVVMAEKLFCRMEPSLLADAYGKISMGDVVPVMGIPVGGWVEVYIDQKGINAYVSADFVSLQAGEGVGMTLQEEEDYLASLTPPTTQAPETQPPVTQPPVTQPPETETESKLEPSVVPPYEQLPPPVLDTEGMTQQEIINATIDAYHAMGNPEHASIYMSPEDVKLFATVIRLECGHEPYEGQMAVANVVLNRLRWGYWGDTLSDVIYAPGQFSITKINPETGESKLEQFLRDDLATEQCYQVVYEALAGHNNIEDYIFFCSKKSADANNKYERFERYVQIGNHVFYMRKK